MFRVTLALCALFAPLAAAAPTDGGFVPGEIWMNCTSMPGFPNGGLFQVDPLTGQPQLVLAYTATSGAQELGQAFCYDPNRDRLLLLAALDAPFVKLWSIDALGNKTEMPWTPGNALALAPALDGKVYIAHTGNNTSPLPQLRWLDTAGQPHALMNAAGTSYANPFIGSQNVVSASLVYDAPSHSLLYAVGVSGLSCQIFGGSGKGSLYRLNLSPDGERVLSWTCVFYDIDGETLNTGGHPMGFSRGPGSSHLLVFRGDGAGGTLNDAAPRLQLASANPVGLSPFASNGPYVSAGWSWGGLYSSVRHDALIADSGANGLRAFDLGESGAGTLLAGGLIGGAGSFERGGFVEIGPLTPLSDTLSGVPSAVSIATGGSQTLSVDFGDGLAGKGYFVIGSASGTLPGFDLKGHHVPLSLDAYTQITLSSPNGFLVANSFGPLDAAGHATATFALPPGAPASLAGLVLNHAALALNGNHVLQVSNAVPVTLVP